MIEFYGWEFQGDSQLGFVEGTEKCLCLRRIMEHNRHVILISSSKLSSKKDMIVRSDLGCFNSPRRP